jgi:hypothetical protein
MKEAIERRKDKRFRTEDGWLAIMWPASSKAGHIVDISLGGLAFRYGARSKLEGCASELESDIEIICSRDEFSSGLFPVENICDIRIEGIFSDLIPMQLRRHSVKFKQLNEEQRFLLECFIEKHCYSLTD